MVGSGHYIKGTEGDNRDGGEGCTDKGTRMSGGEGKRGVTRICVPGRRQWEKSTEEGVLACAEEVWVREEVGDDAGGTWQRACGGEAP